MEKICEEINYVAYSILVVASITFMVVTVMTHEPLFLIPAAISLLQAFAHGIAVMASRERQRENDEPAAT